jgi:hypothetical protein
MSIVPNDAAHLFVRNAAIPGMATCCCSALKAASAAQLYTLHLQIFFNAGTGENSSHRPNKIFCF